MITAGDSKVNFFFPVESTRCFSPGISDQHKTNSILCVCVLGALLFHFVLFWLFFFFFVCFDFLYFESEGESERERKRQMEKDRERKSERLGREVGGLGKVGR